MRLGPLEVRFAAARPATGEQGYSGAPSSGGSRVFGKETDPTTVWSNLSTRWTTVQQMLTDADVSAALDAVLLPVLAAGLTIEPGENTPAGREAAAFLQNDLENMSLSLADFRMAALLGALSDGVSIFEKVWQNGDDGLIHLRKLGERPPRTIASDGWKTDDNGGPKAIIQLNDLGEPIELPIDRLLMYIHRRRQGSLVGESLLRRVYGHWRIKSDLMRIAATGVARHIGGVPTMRPRSKDPTYLGQVDTLLAGIATYEHQFVRLDTDQEIGDFEVKGVQGTLADAGPQLDYHRRGIYLGLLCPFLPLGSDGVGSMALSETQSGFFLMLLRTVAALEEDTINRYLIQQWCSYNWTIDEGALPKAKVGRLDKRDVGAWFKAVVDAVNSGAITVTDQLREMAEEQLGIERPDAADTTQTSGEAEGEGAAADEKETDARAAENASLAEMAVEFGFRRTKQANSQRARQHLGEKCEVCGATRNLVAHHIYANDRSDGDEVQTVCRTCHDEWTGFTQKGGGHKRITAARLEEYRKSARMAAPPDLPSVTAIRALGIDARFDQIATGMDAAEERLVKRLTALQRSQARRLVSIARKAIRDRDTGALETTTVDSDREAEEIEAVMAEVLADASDEYAHELASQGVKPEKPSDDDRTARLAIIAALAAETARRLADRMRTAWGAAVTGGMVARTAGATGAVDAEALAALITAAPEKLLVDLARQSVSLSVGMGRSLTAVANADLIGEEIYSTYLDGRVCPECAQWEGKPFPVGQGPQAPNPGCAGTILRCRCLRIGVAKRP